MIPLAPLPIVVWSAIATAILWSFDATDDFAGWALAIAASHLLLWLGLRGGPAAPATAGQRLAIAIAGAIPSGACPAALTPWLAGGGGLESLGTVVMMMLFGIPLIVAGFAVLIYFMSDGRHVEALRRTLAIVGGAVALAWLLALAWGPAHGRSSQEIIALFVFPGLSSWWLGLPALQLWRWRTA